MGALFAVAGTLSVGQLSCFLTYANQYTKPFNEVTGVLTQLQTGIAAAGRVFEVLEADNEIPDNSTKELEHCKGNVKIENVNFSYTKEKPLITNFSLNVKSGSHIAIVGPTGCGKTTFINLLMRFYDTDSGKISIDGVDIMDITRDNLRKMLRNGSSGQLAVQRNDYGKSALRQRKRNRRRSYYRCKGSICALIHPPYV